MKQLSKYLILVGVTALFTTACREDRPEIGDPPSASEANFSYTPSANTPNIINFSSNATGGQVFWDFGNGTSAEGKEVRGVFPVKGDYKVKSQVFTRGGSVSSTQSVNIANDDFTLLEDSLLTWLTGGIDSVNGKTWVIDSNSTTHFGVGPNPPSSLGFTPEFYSATPLEKSGVGLYDDRYTFKLVGFGFDMKNNGDVYLHNTYQNDFAGSFQNKGDYTAPYPEQLDKSWSLAFDAGADTTLSLSSSPAPGAWLGMYTGVNSYKIISISRNHMFLYQLQGNDPTLAWYLRLIPEGYVPSGGGGGGTTGFSLPFDFETIEPAFVGFGGSSASIEDNADKRGINTSNRVLETTHGNETWAGVEVNLDSKLDFSTDSLIKLKVWSPSAGDTLRVKLEDQANTNVFVEKDVIIPVAFTWVEVEVGFSTSPSNTYDKLVLFPGWGVVSSKTYQIDDIRQDN